MIKGLVIVLLLFLVIDALLLLIGVVTGWLLRLIFTDMNLGLGLVVGVLGPASAAP